MINRRQVLGSLIALPAALALAGCSRQETLDNITGIPLSDASLGRDFALTGADGKPYTLASFQGKPLLVFFGFTQCPDVCPTALLRAAEVKRMLGEDADQLQVAFITVDPERDTPEILAAYTQAFDPEFVGLYGTPEQTAAVAREFKIYYNKVPTGSSYTIDHTALSYVYDAQGKLRLALRHTQGAEDYASDIRKVIALGRS